MNMHNLVFVYGTLKRGFGNWSWCLNNDQSVFVGEHTTEDDFTMVDLGAFPGVVLEGNTPISGELFKVDEEVMASLDSLEGYPTFYNRTLISTPLGDAWMYFLVDKEGWDGRTIDSGVWK